MDRATDRGALALPTAFDRLGFKCTFTPKAKRRLRLRHNVTTTRWTDYVQRHGGSVAAATRHLTPELVELVTFHGMDPDHRAQMWMQWVSGRRGGGCTQYCEC